MTAHPPTPSASRPASPDRPPSRLGISPAELADLRSAVEASRERYLRDLERLVSIDSGSYSKAGVDEVGRWVARQLEDLGASIVRHPHDEFGDTWVATFEGASPRPIVLLIGHADTVFEDGTAASRPYRVDGGRVLGPGVSDMKSGLLLGIHALAALRSLAGSPSALATWLPVGQLHFIVNPDEEIGSPVSSPVIRDHARVADAAFVLESARANGDIVTARKGMTDIRVTIEGRGAHAGVEPEKGRSAVLEAAHKTVALHLINGRWEDVTVNVGVIDGGSRPNVVAAEASLTLDIRAASGAHLEQAEAAVRDIVASSTVPDVTASLEVLAAHRPMERSDATARLAERAIQLASELGFGLRETATGGASDANTTSAMGVPTLDGLGPIGGDDHAPGEYIELDSIVPRTTLLAALLLAVGRESQAAGRD